MNSVILDGLVSSNPKRLKIDGPIAQTEFFFDAPFEHPYVHFSPNYRAKVRVIAKGNDADWVYDNINEGDHLTISKGFIQTFVKGPGKEFYRIIATSIDQIMSNAVRDVEHKNMGYFSGFFKKQFSSSTIKVRKDADTDEKISIRRVGIEIEATPDIRYGETKITDNLSIMLYGDLADKVDGKLRYKQPIQLCKGVLQPWRGNDLKDYRLYIVATEFDF